jgi:hypothetical protein
MTFPSAIWRILKPGIHGYLFVDADSGRIFPIANDGISRYRGFALWFHDFDDYEIVTTPIKISGAVKISGVNRWLHEYYRIDGDFMQWSNFAADIIHERVTDDEVPLGCLTEHARIANISALQVRPAYDPTNVRSESRHGPADKSAHTAAGNYPG